MFIQNMRTVEFNEYYKENNILFPQFEKLERVWVK